MVVKLEQVLRIIDDFARESDITGKRAEYTFYGLELVDLKKQIKQLEWD